MRSPVCLPVEVRPVPGWPRYYASADGRIWGPQGERKLKIDRYGYQYILTWRPKAQAEGRGTHRRLAVHRAVLEAWIGPCPVNHEARHLDGVPSHNDLTNLCWGTHKENIADRAIHGTASIGERHGAAKLTEADVLEIRRLRGVVTVRALAKRFGVHSATIFSASTGESWRHLT